MVRPSSSLRFLRHPPQLTGASGVFGTFGALRVIPALVTHPNPFNPTTTIKYQLPKSSFVTLKVYDILGREVRTLVDERERAGYYSFTFSASDLASGVYFYRLQAGSFVQVRKLMILK